MKSKYLESLITIKINFPDECVEVEAEYSQYIKIKDHIRKTLKQFGFDMTGADSSNCEYYDCYSKDNSEDIIIQRTRFVLKALKAENIIDISDVKIKSVLIDSTIGDDIFSLKNI